VGKEVYIYHKICFACFLLARYRPVELLAMNVSEEEDSKDTQKMPPHRTCIASRPRLRERFDSIIIILCVSRLARFRYHVRNEHPGDKSLGFANRLARKKHAMQIVPEVFSDSSSLSPDNLYLRRKRSYWDAHC
jgi:hypothetical protein